MARDRAAGQSFRLMRTTGQAWNIGSKLSLLCEARSITYGKRRATARARWVADNSGAAASIGAMEISADELRARLEPLFQENFERFGELGAAASVWQHGRPLL